MQHLLHLIVYALFSSTSPMDCSSPIITSANGVSIESIELAWLDFGNEPGTVYDLELIPSGLTPYGQPTIDSIASFTTTVTGLQSGTEYDIYIRALCTEGPSDWYGPVSATTYIDNTLPCGIALNIPDDNCPEIESYVIAVDSFSGLTLGTDLYLLSVDVIIEHPWMADLTIALRSPSGVSSVLMANRGVGVQNIGDPNDTTCTQVLSFTMTACEDLAELVSVQVGDFLPDASLNVFHDQSQVTGTWHLEICDKASDDIGQLRYVHLNFTESVCDFPPVLSLNQVFDTAAALVGLADESCDTLLLLVWDVNAPDDTLKIIVECAADNINIQPLLPGHTYMFSAQKFCDDHSSAWSCPEMFSTTCDVITLWSGFDQNPDCIAECLSSCSLNDTIWSNSTEDDFDWTAFQGETPTEFTGPGATRFGSGKYLFTETSGDECQVSAVAILNSRCLRISGSEDGCDLSFWYHMYGATVGSLFVEISVDGGYTWDELLHLSGDQGDAWHLASINLFSYNDMLATLRFRTVSGTGFLGDIAIDDLMFFGTPSLNDLEVCYFLDADEDGFGNSDSSICHCALVPPPGFTVNDLDCNDSDPDISPTATELPCNLTDDNCNSEVDEGINPDPVEYLLILEQDASCTGISDGQLEILATGGFAPYTYAWSNGGDSSVISNLAPGLYQATITDASGCIGVTESFEIASLVVIEYFIVAASDPSCIGQTDGFISGIVQGGTEPYKFLWSNGDTTQDVSGLPDGDYQLTVTDQQGCWLVSETVSLAATSTISVSVIQLKHVTCHDGNNGSIRISASGGAVPPFDYTWSNGDTTALTSGLVAGTYTCTIVDSLGCMVVAGPYVITQPAALEVQVVSAIPPLCNSGDDGTIQLSVNGGTAPYFFTWSHGAFGDDVFQLIAGDYTVSISDLHGCDTMLTISLVSPDMLETELDTVMNVQCPGDSTGQIVVNAFGGTPPYRYDWSTGTTDSLQTEGLPTGLYAVTVSDASGCKSSIKEISVISINAPIAITFDSINHVNCHGDSTGFVIALVDIGNPPFSFNWSAGTIHTSLDGRDTLQSLPAGNYQVTITDGTGCVGTSDEALITQPTRLSFTLEELIHNICFGDSTGSIDVSVNGGTPPYIYQWSHGEMTEDLNALPVASYQLVVTDSLGCEISTQTFEIDEADSIHIDFVTQNEMSMQANGWAEVFVSGGNPPYTYLWDTTAGSQTSLLAINLFSGTYFVTITDDEGCAYVASVFVDRSTSVIEEDDNRIRIYPNPARDCVIVEADEMIEEVMIYGIDGRRLEVIIEEDSTGTIRIDVRNFPMGLYLIRVNGYVRKVVIE